MKKNLFVKWTAACLLSAVLLMGCGTPLAQKLGAAIRGGKERALALAKKAGTKFGALVSSKKGSATAKGPSLAQPQKAKSAPASATRGGVQKSASAALAATAKAGSTALANLASAVKNAGASAVKGGVSKTPAAASQAGLRAGPAATSSASLSTGEGAMFESSACTDGLALCADDTHVAFCAGSDWVQLDCGQFGADAQCAEDGTVVDCYSTATEDTGCDASSEGTAYCSDDGHLVACTSGSWVTFDCGALDDGDECAEDATTVDCYATEPAEVACDASLEGFGYCSDDSHVTFCSGGQWSELDCASIDPANVCGESVGTVDCFAAN